MSTLERTIFSAVLVLVTAVNLVIFLGSDSGRAFASELLTTLGPADAVILTGNGEGPDKVADLELRNRDGHLAWSDEPFHRAQSIAFIHVGRPMSQLLQLESYNERRQELQDELLAQDEELRAGLQELVEEIQSLPDGDAGLPELQEEAQRAYERYQQLTQQAQQRSAALEAELISEAYGEIRNAVDVVAEEKNIDVVLRFIPADEPVQAATPNQAQVLIRGRAALHYPDALDITLDVMDELNLQAE